MKISIEMNHNISICPHWPEIEAQMTVSSLDLWKKMGSVALCPAGMPGVRSSRMDP